MQLRQAENDEFQAIRDFYGNLIERMKDRQNTIGWKKGIYPSDQFLSDSIQNGELYVMDAEKDYSACVIVNCDYNDGYNGCPWSIDCGASEILVPHALAVNPAMQGRGIGKAVVNDIIEMAKTSAKKTVRLDILSGNKAAERLYKKSGFKYVQSKNMFYEDTGWTEYTMYELVL